VGATRAARNQEERVASAFGFDPEFSAVYDNVFAGRMLKFGLGADAIDNEKGAAEKKQFLLHSHQWLLF
jgi:hypothetical protein